MRVERVDRAAEPVADKKNALRTECHRTSRPELGFSRLQAVGQSTSRETYRCESADQQDANTQSSHSRSFVRCSEYIPPARPASIVTGRRRPEWEPNAA